MALTESRPLDHTFSAPDFALPGTDGKTYTLESFKNARALVVIFMCNHCPYVIAVQDHINALARKYATQNVALVGINSNDAVRYPDDSFAAMKERAKKEGFVFPYLFDETQSVARAYDAVCTPDPFVFENVSGKKVSGEFVLRYHGRIDDSWKDPARVTKTDLALALDAILAGKSPSAEQIPAMGCSIKWRG